MSCSSSIERTLIAQGSAVHHVDKGATENEHNIFMAKVLIPQSLEDGRKGRVYMNHKLKFIKDKDDSFRKIFMFDPVSEEIFPGREFQPAESGIINSMGYGSLKSATEFRLCLLISNKINSFFVFYELFDKGR